MDRYGRSPDSAGGSSPSEAWLFAQALLGNPIPDPNAAARRARAEREQLKWLAGILTRHEQQLRQLQSEETEARRQRELLQWLAGISEEHERKLNAILSEEADARAKQQRFERFVETSHTQEAEWDPAKHPRGGFPENPGWFSTSGGAGQAASKPDRTGSGREPTGSSQRDAPPPDEMLELAGAWWQTNSLLQQCRRDIERLPAVIASQQAKLASHDGHSNVRVKILAEAQRDLDIARALVPQLEAQKTALEEKYHEAGYDNVHYGTSTTGEMRVGGRGIENVGWAVAMGDSPAGLKPTGVEVDIASVALAGPAILRLGKALLGKALSRAPSRVASESAALEPYGIGRGHHIPAKIAFEGAPGYNATTALAIPREELSRFGIMHSRVTGAQRTLYREFANTGAQVTWAEMERIETEALVRSGMDAGVARATVKRAIDALKKSGVPGPTRIPWGR